MFPIGKLIEVYVNPNNHAESVLIQGSGSNRVFRIIVGIGFVVAGILVKTNFEIVLEIIKTFENIDE